MIRGDDRLLRQDPQLQSFTDRNREWNRGEPAPALVLGKVTAATLIANFRWTYTWEEAQVAGTTPATSTTGLTAQEALSVSELSNTATPTSYSYGVPSADLIGSFQPKAIPVGTYVILSAFRRTDGSLMWLIINTQAISGECP
jgi:hypothetical protein